MYIHDDSNNKKRNVWLGIPILLLLIMLTSACSAANPIPNQNGTSPAPAATGDTNDTTDIKTVTTVNGEIEIPTHPKRIVAEEYLGSLISLNTIPVGAPGLTLQNYYYKDALKDAQDTGVYGKVNPEKIIELRPDLIISGRAESYDVLSKIAPTVIVPYGKLKNAHEELTYFGKLLGKEAEAKAWLEVYDRRIQAAKAKVDKAIPADATFSILEDTEKTIYAYGDNFGRGGQAVYQALGRTPPAKVATQIKEKQWAEISSEVLSNYAGDYIILTSNNRNIENYKTDSIWKVLPAVKNGHLYVWPEERSWYYDPIAVLAQTEELANWLTDGK